ncbi:MAG: YbdD/YjiX family protein [Gemmatimonadaceae bacterium]
MSEIIALASSVARTLRTIIGVPDYDRYVEHCRVHHPECAPMTRDQFAHDRLANKYSKPGTRCC